jgi:RNA polymerase sigma-70 factor (ECF subfamily)
MDDLPKTRPSLLLRLRDPRDGAAWQQCVEIYGSAIYHYARKRGLQDADAADLMQDVLRNLMQAINGLDYDPALGSFRGWLFTLAHRRLCDHLTRTRRECSGTGDTAMIALLQEQPARPEDTQDWDEESERARLNWAAERVRGKVRPGTWQAFWLTAVQGVKPADAAEQLGMPVAQVYLARSRVMARLHNELQWLAPD